MASDGAKGSNYAHSFVSGTSSRCEPNTTPFCASTQALVPWSDTKCGQPFRCFIPIETGVTQHQLNGPHELRQRRRRRQWERQKSKTTTLHVHHAFLYISLPSPHDFDVKMPYFTFCGEREHKTTALQSFRIQLRKEWQYLTNWRIWNKRDKICSSVNSPFNWRFRSRNYRCCLSSVMIQSAQGLTLSLPFPCYLVFPSSPNRLGSRSLKVYSS